jgi:hypothetical protein
MLLLRILPLQRYLVCYLASKQEYIPQGEVKSGSQHAYLCVNCPLTCIMRLCNHFGWSCSYAYRIGIPYIDRSQNIWQHCATKFLIIFEVAMAQPCNRSELSHLMVSAVVCIHGCLFNRILSCPCKEYLQSWMIIYLNSRTIVVEIGELQLSQLM